MPTRTIYMLLLAAMSGQVLPSSAQSLFHRADSILAARYYRLGNIDTAYISRPQRPRASRTASISSRR